MVAKLSASLKALVEAPFARPGPCPSTETVKDFYVSLRNDASRRGLGMRPWVTMSAAATFTLNSPQSLTVLHRIASTNHPESATSIAELIREVGLKCISFNGIPRTINCLTAFRSSLPTEVQSALDTKSRRAPSEASLSATSERGRGLWNSIYSPFDEKLLDKLARGHPDLPVVILNYHYGPLLADPSLAGGEQQGGTASLGRFLTSIVGVACLRAQTGTGPQVMSHIYGLRQAFDDSSWKDDKGLCDEPGESLDEKKKVVQWLASDEGGEWILVNIDALVEALGGSNFAPIKASKL